MKNLTKKISIITLIAVVITTFCNYAGVNGGTEDIIAPTAPSSQYNNDQGPMQYDVINKEKSGYNGAANNSIKSPLNPLGFNATIGNNPGNQITSVANGPYDNRTPLSLVDIANTLNATNSVNMNNMPTAANVINNYDTYSNPFSGNVGQQSTKISYDTVDNYTKGVTVGAPSAILVNATTRKVYFGKNQNATYLPAGLGNLLTAYIALQTIGLDEDLKVNLTAVKGVDKDASIAALNAGDTITLKDAIGAMYTKGCVDCANVIAENVSGSIESFVELMNTTVKEFGCENTIFKNPSGLDADGQVTSCYDVAIIMDKITENEDLVDLMSRTEYKLPKVSGRDDIILYSKNTMLSEGSQNYNADIDCSRLGYTKKAEYTMASKFDYEKNKFIIVVLKAKGTHFSDTRKLYEYAKKMMDGES